MKKLNAIRKILKARGISTKRKLEGIRHVLDSDDLLVESLADIWSKPRRNLADALKANKKEIVYNHPAAGYEPGNLS
jgi:nucleotidyltransferase/DNA polymerase involved in DNA repair